MILFSLGSSDISPANSVNNFLRSIFSVLDTIAFFLLTFVFQLFFNVSTVDIFSNETILTFYYRIQVILGVFMMFQLAMTIIKGIVDPDSFNDKKTGAASLIRRIAIALIMLVLLVPIRYNNPSNEYEKQLNNNGILFGTLYSLQHRIIQGNVIGKLVLGEDADNENYLENQEALKSESYKFASSVLRVFYRINLKDEDGSLENDDDWMCREWPEGTYELYTQDDANPLQIIQLVHMSCDDDGTAKKWYQSILFLQGDTRYHIAYMPIIPAVVGLLLAALILSFSIDVGIRAIKLGFLKLLAPIPIISYMDPKGSKDSAFNSWVKQLTSTYIDLFVRLVLIYFILSIVKEIQEHGFVVGNGAEVDGIMAGLTKIIIFIALFLFAKQAPKFFKSLFGIKDDGDGFGGLFKSLGTAIGLGAAGIGALGSFNASRRASREADIARYTQEELDRNPGLSEEDARARAEQRAGRMANRGKHLVAGIFGGAAGGLAGVGAALGAKDHATRAALDAQHNRNAAALAAGRSGGTLGGALGSSFREMLTGESAASADEVNWAAEEARLKADELALKTAQDANNRRKNIMDRAKSKAKESTQTIGTYKGVTANYRDFHSAYTAAMEQGIGIRTNSSGQQVFDYNGQEILASQAQSIDMGLYEENTANYYDQVVAGTIDDKSISGDRDAFSAATGQPLEATFGGKYGLKATYGENANENKATSDRINREKQDLNTRRTSRTAQRNKTNAERFRSGGKK